MRRDHLRQLGGILAAAIAGRALAGEGPEERAVRDARATLDRLIAAFEAGNAFQIENEIGHAMVSRQRLVDGIRATLAARRQARLTLRNVRFVYGPDMVVFTANWERRWLHLPTGTPSLSTGTTSFMIQLSSGRWLLTGLSGDNPFVK